MSKYENKNALKHGAFAEVAILPNEDSKEFEELHDTVLCEWNPEGPTEHGLVMSLTKDLWRKRRLGRFYQREIEKLLERRRELERLDKVMFPLLESVLFEPGSENLRPITEQELSDILGAPAANHFKAQCPRENYKDDRSWLSAIQEKILELLANVQSDPRTAVAMVQDELSDEEFSNREMEIEERIDARIEKTTKRLGQIKTMKAIGIGNRRVSVTNQPLQQIEVAAGMDARNESNNH
jgi:hypothetical protein